MQLIIMFPVILHSNADIQQVFTILSFLKTKADVHMFILPSESLGESINLHQCMLWN